MKSATGQDGKADGGIAVRQGNPPCVWCGSEKTVRAGRRELKASVEGFFLSCDRNTIATEVPVWHYDKQHGSIAGHIDIVQVNFGKLWVLDYKPNAAKEDPAKVATQLTLYARGLAYRAQVPLGEMRCAWFDEADCFSFRPGWG